MPISLVVWSHGWQSEVVTISPDAWRAGRIHEIVSFCTDSGGDAPDANNLSFRCPDVACGHHQRASVNPDCPPAVLSRCRKRLSTTCDERKVVRSNGAGKFNQHSADTEAGCDLIRPGLCAGQIDIFFSAATCKATNIESSNLKPPTAFPKSDLRLGKRSTDMKAKRAGAQVSLRIERLKHSVRATSMRFTKRSWIGKKWTSVARICAARIFVEPT